MTTMGNQEAFELWFKAAKKQNPKPFTKEFVKRAFVDGWDCSLLVNGHPNHPMSQSTKMKTRSRK